MDHRSSDEPLITSEPSRFASPHTNDRDEDGPQGNSGVTVMRTDNEGAQRKWDKKHFCFFCDEPQAKLPRHLQSCHNEEREVVEIASQTDCCARVTVKNGALE